MIPKETIKVAEQIREIMSKFKDKNDVIYLINEARNYLNDKY